MKRKHDRENWDCFFVSLTAVPFVSILHLAIQYILTLFALCFPILQCNNVNMKDGDINCGKCGQSWEASKKAMRLDKQNKHEKEQERIAKLKAKGEWVDPKELLKQKWAEEDRERADRERIARGEVLMEAKGEDDDGKGGEEKEDNAVREAKK